MRKFKSLGILCAALIMGLSSVENSFGQATPPDNSKSAKTAKERDKQAWKRQRKVDRATKAALKAHMKRQPKDVQKRMKQDAKKANKYNSAR